MKMTEGRLPRRGGKGMGLCRMHEILTGGAKGEREWATEQCREKILSNETKADKRRICLEDRNSVDCNWNEELEAVRSRGWSLMGKVIGYTGNRTGKAVNSTSLLESNGNHIIKFKSWLYHFPAV